MDADEKSLLTQVVRVVYRLHPTFRNPLREVRSRENDFGMATFAWGEFNLKAKVYFANGKTIDLERYIDFVV
jgi:transcription initiation factor IIF auxiliary subunit